MNFEEIRYEKSDGVATITLHRPEKLNAWTFSMEGEYRRALVEAESDSEVKVIVVTGAGKGFCAGADMSLLSSVQQGNLDVDDAPLDLRVGEKGADREDFRKPYSFPPAVGKPIIAAINGAAVGLGLVHALYCDIRFASERAKFGTAFAQRGLIAEHGLSWLLPRVVGLEHALDLLLSARIVEAEEALRIGLVSRVLPHDELLPAVYAYAREMAARCSPRSMAIIKRQVWHDQLEGLAASCDVAIREMMESFATEDFAEGVLSYIERRPPAFTGR